jgi:hypothetical protein
MATYGRTIRLGAAGIGCTLRLVEIDGELRRGRRLNGCCGGYPLKMLRPTPLINPSNGRRAPLRRRTFADTKCKVRNYRRRPPCCSIHFST